MIFVRTISEEEEEAKEEAKEEDFFASHDRARRARWDLHARCRPTLTLTQSANDEEEDV